MHCAIIAPSCNLSSTGVAAMHIAAPERACSRGHGRTSTHSPTFDDPRYGPWHPGIESQIPGDLLPLATLFRPEHVRSAAADVAGARRPDRPAAARARRVSSRAARAARGARCASRPTSPSPTASASRTSGSTSGRSRSVLLDRHVAPRDGRRSRPRTHARAHEAAAVIERELARSFAPPVAVAAARRHRPGRRVLSATRGAPAHAPDGRDTGSGLVADWDARARAGGDEVERAALRALARTVSALLVRHGELWGDRGVIARVAVGARGQRRRQRRDRRADRAYRRRRGRGARAIALLPRQAQPVVMNTKGPSAAGKSTMRPLQKQLAGPHRRATGASSR